MNEPKKKQLARFMETKRFVVSVDHQAKRSYDTREEADAEAKRISTAYPVVAVHVTDIEQDSRNLAKLAPTPEEKRAAEAAHEAAAEAEQAKQDAG